MITTTTAIVACLLSSLCTGAIITALHRAKLERQRAITGFYERRADRFDDALHTIWFGTLDTRPSSDPATHAIAANALFSCEQ